MFDYLIAGAGFSGAVLAERLAAAGSSVLVVDRRAHIGGNAYDHVDEAGVLIHDYGPHIFHTNSARVFDYLSRFTAWRRYEHRVLAFVEGKYLPIPINLDTVNRLYGLAMDSEQLEAFFRERAEPVAQVRTSEDVVVAGVGRDLYEKFFRGYTRKQWGMDPSELDAAVAGRVPFRTDRDDRYFTDTHQAMPLHGYTAMFRRMLSNPNICVWLKTDFRDAMLSISHRAVIYTGPIDEYFDHCFGKLPYRSINFRFETHRAQRLQQTATINYPNDHDYTRVTEFKQITGQCGPATTLCYEYPTGEGDPYYPIPRPENAELYRRYAALAEGLPNVHFAGRLGTYKYYNMDQVVAQALTLADKLLARRCHW